MNGRYLLDTNIVIALFAQDQSIQDHLYRAEEVLIPSIVLGELYYGALKSARVETNQARIDEFASSSVIVGCDWGLLEYMDRSKTGCGQKADQFRKTICGLLR